jgi:hypothetical protein
MHAQNYSVNPILAFGEHWEHAPAASQPHRKTFYNKQYFRYFDFSIFQFL